MARSRISPSFIRIIMSSPHDVAEDPYTHRRRRPDAEAEGVNGDDDAAGESDDGEDAAPAEDGIEALTNTMDANRSTITVPSCSAFSSGTPAAIKMAEFTNSHLLKINTMDQYSTATALKKQIAKALFHNRSAAAAVDTSSSSDTTNAINTTEAAIAANAASSLPGLLRVGKNPKNIYAFFAFDTDANRASAESFLTTHLKTRSRPWVACKVTPSDLSQTHRLGNKRERVDVTPLQGQPGGQQGLDGQGGAAAAGAGGGTSVCPWRGVSYEEQIRRKAEHCRGVVKSLAAARPGLPSAVVDGTLMTHVVRSPVVDGYRNNVNLTCGYDKTGAPTVGFLVGACLDGHDAVDGDVASIPTCHPLVSAIVDRFMTQVFRPLLAQCAAATMYRKAAHAGFWRRLHIRHSSELEVMIDVEVHGVVAPPDPEQPSFSFSEMLQRATALLTHAFQNVDVAFHPVASDAEGSLETASASALPACAKMQDTTKTCRVVSMQCHEYSGTNNSAPNDLARQIIFGTSTLKESVFGIAFELSPTAFFQVNREGLIAMLNELSRLTPELSAATSKSSGPTLLLDICCGTGTLGLCLAAGVDHVVGVEMVADAVHNAIINAKRNGQSDKTTYVCGRVEKVFQGSLLPRIRAHAGPIIALLDPPRTGVHANVLRALRAEAAIDTLIYISCDQKALVHDGTLLMKPSSHNFPGEPFDLDAAIGVDLFPHTPHVEMVAVFRRTAQRQAAGHARESLAAASAPAA